MKKLGHWLARSIGTAIVLVLVIVMLPYASRLAQKLFPDLSNRAVKASVILSQQMQESARLETTLLQEEGILTSSADALLIGTVQQVSVHYAYQASIGIDLTKVEMHPSGSQLTLVLPPAEILTDSITPLTIERNDFWYPLTDDQLQKLLEDERELRRNACLAAYTASEEGWRSICRALDTTIALWLNGAGDGLTLVYAPAEQE